MMRETKVDLSEPVEWITKWHGEWKYNDAMREPKEIKIGRHNLEEILNNEYLLLHVDLSSADLHNVNLKYVNLCCTSLYNANLYGTDFSHANLHCADLYNADLRNVIFYNADLRGADLRDADLRGADFSFANLHNADLSNAIMDETTNIFVPLACPSEGEFFGWKKVGNYIIKLQIPKNAKRSSATTNKCRCDRAKVLEIQNMDGALSNVTMVKNNSYSSCIYEVNKIVYPDSFDTNRWNECSHGIHFFIDRESAVRY